MRSSDYSVQIGSVVQILMIVESVQVGLLQTFQTTHWTVLVNAAALPNLMIAVFAMVMVNLVKIVKVHQMVPW